MTSGKHAWTDDGRASGPDPVMRRVLPVLLTLLMLFLLPGLLPAQAGVMTREAMLKAFPAPLIVGEKERELPVWPILKQDGTATPVVAYVFESIDLAPIPGFSGTPFNLLVALDAKGAFMDVRVLSQHEPVFLDGLGEGPMLDFVRQYKGLSLMQNIKIGNGGNTGNNSSKAGSANVYIDGVAKATASVRILNQSLLSASLKVARARMGYAKGRDPDLIARVRPDVFAAMDWDALTQAGLDHRQALQQRRHRAGLQGQRGRRPGRRRPPRARRAFHRPERRLPERAVRGPQPAHAAGLGLSAAPPGAGRPCAAGDRQRPLFVRRRGFCPGRDTRPADAAAGEPADGNPRPRPGRHAETSARAAGRRVARAPHQRAGRAGPGAGAELQAAHHAQQGPDLPRAGQPRLCLQRGAARGLFRGGACRQQDLACDLARAQRRAGAAAGRAGGCWPGRWPGRPGCRAARRGWRISAPATCCSRCCSSAGTRRASSRWSTSRRWCRPCWPGAAWIFSCTTR